jgi:acetyltransferase-like isoleucine patch superfamily enzyme
VRRLLLIWTMRAVAARDRLWLRWLQWLNPGLDVDSSAAPALAVARFAIAPGGSLRIGPGVATERIRGALHIQVAAGAHVEVGPDTWLRTELGPVHVIAFEGARIELGRGAFLNGCHLSAKTRVTLGEKAQVGPGSRVFDSDQHDFDDGRPEQQAPVSIGDHAWVAADVTVLKGVSIGAHSIVGARSLVTGDVPPHRLAFGIPARVHGEVGDRSRCR